MSQSRQENEKNSSEADASAAALEEDLICPVGLSIFINPVVLDPCGHVFEHSNIQLHFGKQRQQEEKRQRDIGLYRANIAQLMSGEMSSEAQESIRIFNQVIEMLNRDKYETRCPMCRTLTPAEPKCAPQEMQDKLSKFYSTRPDLLLSLLQDLLANSQDVMAMQNTHRILRWIINYDYLNRISQDSELKGKSAVYELAQYAPWMFRSRNMREIANADALNAICNLQPFPCTSAFWFLLKDQTGLSLFIKHSSFRAKISSEGLNTICQARDDTSGRGYSSLTWLTLSEAGMRLLAKDNKLRGKITDVGLNQSVRGVENYFSPLHAILDDPIMFSVFIGDEILCNKVNERGMNAISPQGLSAVTYLAGNVQGIRLLYENKDLRSKIQEHGLNTISREQSVGFGAVSLLANHPLGKKLLLQDEVLRQKINRDGMNTLIETEDGDCKGYSAGILLATSLDGQEILLVDQRLCELINPDTLTLPLKEGRSAIDIMQESAAGRILIRQYWTHLVKEPIEPTLNESRGSALHLPPLSKLNLPPLKSISQSESLASKKIEPVPRLHRPANLSDILSSDSPRTSDTHSPRFFSHPFAPSDDAASSGVEEEHRQDNESELVNRRSRDG